MKDKKNIPTEETSKKEKKGQAKIAKKDFVICHNDYFKEIKVGDDVSDVPEHFHVNLKTEGVL